jgi:uncharacterized lipoprotein YehR (DUF1307 family)
MECEQMDNKKLMWLMLAVIIVFAGFNIFQFFNNQSNFKQVEFTAIYTFDRSLSTTIENTVVFAFENQEDLQKTLNEFNEIPMEDRLKSYNEVLDKLEEKAERPVEALDFNSEAYAVDGLLYIKEENLINGMTEEKDGIWRTSFGENQLELKETQNSKLVFILPEDAEIISVKPDPTKIEGNVLTWEKAGLITFPNVEYK